MSNVKATIVGDCGQAIPHGVPGYERECVLLDIKNETWLINRGTAERCDFRPVVAGGDPTLDDCATSALDKIGLMEVDITPPPE
jgi:hypothetical protein